MKMIQIRVFCGQSSVRWLLLLFTLYFTNWEGEMVPLMTTRSDQTVFNGGPNFFFSSALQQILPMPIDSCYSDAMVCYLQSCECKEFLLFVLFVLWIAVGILKNIRTIKLEQLFSKYLILWTLHCGNSRALAVSERALNGTYLMSRICIKHSSILLSWLHPWSIRNLGNLDLKYFKTNYRWWYFAT